MAYQYDSRQIQSGDTFLCLPGGEKYLDDVYSRGAVRHIVLNRHEMAELADREFGSPSQRLCVIGVTGTNGKTTVTTVLAQCLNQLGFNVALQGTITGSLTTPESWDTQAAMADHVKKGGTHFVMEVSSHGIDQGRIDHIQFAVKLLTNISQDHLDYHKTFEVYRQVKMRFMREWPGIAILPEDYKTQVLPEKLPLLGEFNRENLQAVSAILRALKIAPDAIASVLQHAKAPPGRFEPIRVGQPFDVIIDYAHTPDGLERVLTTARDIADKRRGRVLTLFGCGGNRDRGKRPLMAEVTCRLSEYVVITQDNPRSEDPTQIMADIVSGIPENYGNYKIIDDRKAAIEHILSIAKPGDIVMLTGKGHETQQILATGPVPFDEREIVRGIFLDNPNQYFG